VNSPRDLATAHETFITSQTAPVHPGAQLHSNWCPTWRQVPPFWHGTFDPWHQSMMFSQRGPMKPTGQWQWKPASNAVDTFDVDDTDISDE